MPTMALHLGTASMSPADRQRAYRKRIRRHQGVLRVVVDLFGFADALIEAGELSEAETQSRHHLEAKAAQIIERWKISVMRNASGRLTAGTLGKSDNPRTTADVGKA
ncbi:hypothetical protein [Mesorhizobium sp. CN2-181]|uniref:hypothetical protein n=1 Tax=Mesorhizobium yinganensis TaxID=3157707 RepID=UPI0032B7C617